MIGYHISARRNRESILAHGLRTESPMTSEQFAGTAPCRLWLFVDRAQAEAMLGGNWGGSRGDNDLWQLDLEGVELHPDPHTTGTGEWPDGRYASARVAHQPIPPERLSLTEALAWTG